jgi:hypothetical protein
MLPPLRELLGSTASTATGAPFHQHHAEAFDKGALAHPRHTGDAQADGLSRVRQQPVDTAAPVPGAPEGAFNQGDGLGQDAAVAGQHAVYNIVGIAEKMARFVRRLGGPSMLTGVHAFFQGVEHLVGRIRNGRSRSEYAHARPP